MLELKTLIKCDNKFTDKNSKHSYFPVYEKLFNDFRNNEINLLEVGIYKGGSVKLWSDYFPKANIYACDIEDNIKIPEIKKNERIKLDFKQNAYDLQYVNDKYISNNIQFDILIDDGPHTLDSMKQFIDLYLPLIKYNGILVIEDVKSLEWIEELKRHTPNILQPFIEVYDLRENKKRYDDILFVINLNKL